MSANLNAPAGAGTHDVAARKPQDIDSPWPANIDAIIPAAAEPTLQTPEVCPIELRHKHHIVCTHICRLEDNSEAWVRRSLLMFQSGSRAERGSGDILNGTEMSPEDGFDGVLIEPQNSGPTHLQAPITQNVR